MLCCSRKIYSLQYRCEIEPRIAKNLNLLMAESGNYKYPTLHQSQKKVSQKLITPILLKINVVQNFKHFSLQSSHNGTHIRRCGFFLI